MTDDAFKRVDFLFVASAHKGCYAFAQIVDHGKKPLGTRMEDAVAAHAIEDDSAAIELGSTKARMHKTQGDVIDIPSFSGVTPTVYDNVAFTRGFRGFARSRNASKAENTLIHVRECAHVAREGRNVATFDRQEDFS